MKRKNVIILVAVLLLLVIVTPIMFFYLTTMMATPKTVHVVANNTSNNENIRTYDSSITILIVDTNEFVCYKDKALAKKLSLQEIRGFLMKEKSEITEMAVIIKPVKENLYKSTVDILDEMQINDIKRYAIVDATKEDIDLANRMK
ncbi:MAG: biopolymer transporter ExbD [Lacibacter sp.]